MSRNWVCPQCGAFNPQRKDICWQCGTSRTEEDQPALSPASSPGHPSYGMGYVVLCLVSIGGGYGLLRLGWNPNELKSWLLWAISAGIILGAILRYRFALIQKKHSSRSCLNSRAIIFATLAQAALLAMVSGFVGLSRHCRSIGCCSPSVTGAIQQGICKWLPPFAFLAVFLIHGIGKLLIRRTRGQTAESARKLQQDMDVLSIFVASIVGISMRRLPTLYLLGPITYFLLRLDIARRKRRGREVSPMPSNATSQIIVTSQLVFSGLALWPFWRRGLHKAAIPFMMVWVAYQIKDWLLAAALLKPTSPMYQRIKTWVKHIADWGPLALRLMLVFSLASWALMGILIIGHLLAENPTPEAVERLFPLIIVAVCGIIMITLMIILGLAGRVAAIALLLISFLYPLPSRSIEWYAVLLLYLGTGRLSLWTEDKLLRRWAAADVPASHPGATHTQLSSTHPSAVGFERPVAWHEPFKLGQPLKIITGVATVMLTGYYVLALVLAIIVAFSGITSGIETFPNLMEHPAIAYVWEANLLFGFVYFGLIAFYFVHLIKNTAAPGATRIIFGIGMVSLPFIAMPLYYGAYIHRDPPPAWALRKTKVERASKT